MLSDLEAKGSYVIRFGGKGKLSPRYIRPFEIMKRIGTIALVLTPSLEGVSAP